MNITSSCYYKKIERLILSPLFVFLVILLFANDHIFKYSFPSFITGKLSDFVGLFITPIFIVYILRLNRVKYISRVYFFIGLVFTIINIPSLSGDFFKKESLAPFFVYYPDLTDLFALSVLPFSLLYLINETRKEYKVSANASKRILKPLAIVFSALTIMATSANDDSIVAPDEMFDERDFSNERSVYKLGDSIPFKFKLNSQDVTSVTGDIDLIDLLYNDEDFELSLQSGTQDGSNTFNFIKEGDSFNASGIVLPKKSGKFYLSYKIIKTSTDGETQSADDGVDLYIDAQNTFDWIENEITPEGEALSISSGSKIEIKFSTLKTGEDAPYGSLSFFKMDDEKISDLFNIEFPSCTLKKIDTEKLDFTFVQSDESTWECYITLTPLKTNIIDLEIGIWNYKESKDYFESRYFEITE